MPRQSDLAPDVAGEQDFLRAKPSSGPGWPGTKEGARSCNRKQDAEMLEVITGRVVPGASTLPS